jgi:hypothetical protein
MSSDVSIPVYELTDHHFSSDPVWQFKLESGGERESDESHAVPASNGLHLGTYGSFMVHARYLLTSGHELPGAVQVDILGQKVVFTPTFLYVGGKSIDPLSADIETRISRITRQPKSRPTKWILRATFAGEADPRSGRIWKSRLLLGLGLLARLVSLRLIPRGKA